MQGTFIHTVCYVMKSSLVQRITTAFFFLEGGGGGEFQKGDCLIGEVSQYLLTSAYIYIYIYRSNRIISINFQRL